jgi:outer membrane protein assembly factor BamB
MCVYAVRRHFDVTAKLLWAFQTKGLIVSSPAVLEDPKQGVGYVFFASADGGVYAVNTQTGDQLWRFDTGAPGL